MRRALRLGRRPANAPDADSGKLDLVQLRRLLGFARPYRVRLVVGIIAVGVASALGLAFPLLIRDLFNTAFDPQAAHAGLNRIALTLFGLFVGQAGFNYVRTYNLGLVGEALVADMRKALFDHVIGLSVRFFETRKTGEITSRLTSDVGTVQNAVSQALAQFVNQLITLVGGVIVLLVLNLRLTLVMLAIVPAVVLAAAYFGRQLRRISTRFQDAVGEANASAEEAISGVRVVKSFTAEGYERRRYGVGIDASYRLALRRLRVRALFVPTVILAMSSGIGVVLWYGGRLVLSGALGGGDLIAFLLITVFVAGSIGSFTGLYSQLQEALGASRRIFELLDAVSDLPEPGDPVHLAAPRGEVRFEGVSFRYGDRGEALVLEGVDLVAEPGRVVALVGPSGAGKSTLVSLVARFYDPTAGHILLDGVDLRRLPTRELRAVIGSVPQETQLFSGSVAENIRYGRQGADDGAVVKAARAANADGFIRAFEGGYDTLVGERGVKLSGGQRQRVAIARALLKDPRILILDEATSSLDSESEALVQDALQRLMRGRTTFVIAHRLSTVLGADTVLVLDQGRIVQRGSHDALLAQGGLYRDLFERQFRSLEGAAGPA
ncbi:MAG TPA: ABC transporter transmembrane domain-containing protein [Trueperaceae bacterium]|nr:ABC transporter transmembrane domain-containing protein [Trueperaceae bacterium]